LLLIATGAVPVQSGYFFGVLTEVLFLSVILYGGAWLVRSRLPPVRYHRIGVWTVGGAVAAAVLLLPITAFSVGNGLFFLLGTARWGGTVGGAVGFGIGIMEAQAIEQRRTAERLDARQEMLQRERDRLDEFASIISHDLRNPLNVAASRLELARAESKTDHHDDIEEALDRMEVIVEDTLTLARHGQQVGETERVPLGSVARRSWQTISQTGAELQIEESRPLEADPARVEHIFENLYRNALEHADDDPTVRVGVLADPEGFYVADDGPGIPPDRRAEVFDRGYTSDDDGTGLGLTIVRSIADAHDWQVDVTEGNDGGARFEFTDVTVHRPSA
jgi:signal transduction histidine kinase